MSIIYDALKKVERLGNIVSQAKLDKESRPKLQKRKFQVYFLYALVVFSGFFIANVFFNFLKPRHVPKATVAPLPKEEPVMLETKETKPAEPQPQPSPKPSLVLNGVFYSQEQGYALINNQILKEGDTIEGAVVKRIGLDEVELELAGGEVIRLSSQR